MVFAAVAAIAIVAGVVRFAISGQPPGILGAVGVVGSCVSATLLAIGARRNRVLDSGLANLLLAIGLCTFPLIVAFAFPAGKWMPAYFTDELPFALSGLAWMVFASRLKRTTLRRESTAQMALS
jgi:peptidoglycan biosynthesis protein MviN/MurJ (putative lipid II flippase)